ncbi:MAG: Type secretion system protein precursor [Verrucomicrobiota bacterium]|jgi:prepilin-type N-terminal cleavage/methylation domain-containing protein
MPLDLYPVRARARAGFTLIELLTVISIIGILAALTLGVAKGVRERAAVQQAGAEMSVISQALESYKRIYGDYPRTLEPGWSGLSSNETKLLQSLIGNYGPKGDAMTGKVLLETSKFSISQNPTTNEPYDPADSANKDKATLVDPWGNPYYYFYGRTSSGNTWAAPGFVLYSAGPDGYSTGESKTTTLGTGATSLITPQGLINKTATEAEGAIDNIYSN